MYKGEMRAEKRGKMRAEHRELCHCGRVFTLFSRGWEREEGRVAKKFWPRGGGGGGGGGSLSVIGDLRKIYICYAVVHVRSYYIEYIR